MARYPWFLGLWLAGSLFCAAQTFTGRVVGVADGDTVTVLLDGNRPQKIRLAGIDAPEKSQAFGTRAKQALSDKVFNRTVTVISNSTDRYHRWVCDIHLENRWINQEMVSGDFQKRTAGASKSGQRVERAKADSLTGRRG